MGGNKLGRVQSHWTVLTQCCFSKSSHIKKGSCHQKQRCACANCILKIVFLNGSRTCWMNNTLNKNELLEENWCHVVSSLKSENYVRPDVLLSYFLFTLKSVELKHVANKGRRKEIC